MNELEKDAYNHRSRHSDRKEEKKRREALPAHADKFIWVLDMSSGNVLKVEIPVHFPENGDYEDYLEANLPEDVSLEDCNWMVSGAEVHDIVRWRYHLGF